MQIDEQEQCIDQEVVQKEYKSLWQKTHLRPIELLHCWLERLLVTAMKGR